MPIDRLTWLWIVLALAALTGCSSPKHEAYVTLPTNNAIGAFRVNNHTGNLERVVGSPFNAGLSPASLVAHPSGKFVYAANQAGDDISVFKVDSETGALTEVMPRAPAGHAPDFLVTDSGGSLLFAANETSNSISAFTISSADGTLSAVSGSPFATVPQPIALAVSPSGKFLYAASANFGTVSGYTITSGTLQAVNGSPFPIGGGPFSLAVDPAEHFLYVANSTASPGTVTVLGIDPASGTLTHPIPGSPFPAGTAPVSLAIDSTGKFLFVANLSSNNISAYTLDGSTGVPTQVTNSPFLAGTAPAVVLIDSTGSFLYVCNQTTKDISRFTIDQTTGQLLSNTVAATTSSAPTSMLTMK